VIARFSRANRFGLDSSLLEIGALCQLSKKGRPSLALFAPIDLQKELAASMLGLW
jgi:hypothetical protein